MFWKRANQPAISAEHPDTVLGGRNVKVLRSEKYGRPLPGRYQVTNESADDKTSQALPDGNNNQY
jgi:hypothetical protein